MTNRMTEVDAGLADRFEKLRAAYKHGWLVKDTEAFKDFCFAHSDEISAALRSSPPPIAGREEIVHTRSCAALGGYAGDCTCCLEERKELATEQEMHRAWRKRAEEAEAKLAASPSAEPVAWSWSPEGTSGRTLGWQKPTQYDRVRDVQPLYASPTTVSDASREALDLLQLQQRGRAQAFRILDSKRDVSDPTTLAMADAYEECGNELKAILSSSDTTSATGKSGSWE